MHLTNESIALLDKNYRTNLINGISGAKPACLIGTQNENGIHNLALFSNIVHIGANPALMGVIFRPIGEESHTYHNIQKSGYFTINHITTDFYKKAHYTSARFPMEISEFDVCQLHSEFLANFSAPFVQEASIKIGLKWKEELPIQSNGTILLVGQIEELFIPDHGIDANGNIQMENMNGISVSGLDTYYQLKEIEKLPYAKKDQLPEF
ncbi:flavin reductase family protein [Aquirufa sp. ROCK2-A2]